MCNCILLNQLLEYLKLYLDWSNVISTWFTIAYFQIGWLLLVIGSQSDYYILGIVWTSIFIASYAKISAPCKHYYSSVLLIVFVGLLTDFLLSNFNLINFGSSSQFIPAWLICLWILFALTFRDSYRWMRSINPVTVFLIGGVFGPLAYKGASLLSDVEVLQPTIFYPVSALFWGSLFTFLAKNNRINQLVFSKKSI
ncbi:MAG: DUF2878 domain-containing protein [Kangiellaceae bacterium]|nr:DUF2878 domain-containing protein [Kangiellaceae bacterium]MCW8997940.1 DUF2878 domain-containing protein [Kangiellaceae bacterium]MCW9017904.1 DUF2878 domain-containing protein [Kangiellaceae bacterium]